MLAEPIDSGFEYEVFVGVAIPVRWVELIKTTGKHHYDHVCNEAADHGCVNGLFNVARWNDERRDVTISTMKLSWRDCDTICKILEQAHYHEKDLKLIGEIVDYFRSLMKRITMRERELDARDKRYEFEVVIK